MKIAYSWLKTYIDIPETPEVLAGLLTATGLEVELVESFESVPGGLNGLVIGEVLTCAKHPNADRLTLTTVDVGGPKPLQIVCGAPNVAAGQKVIVALPETTIYPKKNVPFTIRTSKIRGEHSEGMICAEDEIGLGDSHEGILVLKTDLPNGSPATNYFPVYSDSVFEIGLTPNRADAFSHIGVARDLKAVTKRELRWPDVTAFRPDNTGLTIDVTLENAPACPRYSSLTLTGVKVNQSPEWLKNKLLSIGLSPINNIVDITNFVCHELGQPLHAFDADTIAGGKVIVKTLSKGTAFVTLDGETRKLASTDLMICDKKEALCIAGVFGGIKSGITDKTTSVFLESACFSPEFVRRTSLEHQLVTDASFRFSRGTDPNITVMALKRAALLIKELAGGEISAEVSDIYPTPIDDRIIKMSDQGVDRLIGQPTPREEVLRVLERLDIRFVDGDETQYRVSAPPYRVDVEKQADVVEEFLRIHGFNNIALSPRFRADFIADFPEKDDNKTRNAIGMMLAGKGFYEVLTNSLLDATLQDKQGAGLPGKTIRIVNQLSEELDGMRQSLMFTMLQSAAYNINRKQNVLRMFEFGKIYYLKEKEHMEEERLGLLLTGESDTVNWRKAPETVNFFDLDQQVLDIFERCGVRDVDKQDLDNPMFESGIRLEHRNSVLGHAGRVEASVARSWGVKQEIFYAELSAALLFKAANPKLVIQEVPRFPLVRRDLSLVLDRGITFKEVRKLVMNKGKSLVHDLTVFDVYEGDRIPEGKKAYALAFTLMDKTKTLTDEEIDGTMGTLIEAFEKKLGAVIRKQ